MNKLIEKLSRNHTLSEEEYRILIEGRNEEAAECLAALAGKVRRDIYGNTVFIRGLIEISNICKNDCLYCGIRKSNRNCQRYRLSADDILACCEEGYRLGFRTFVLQGGEDGYYSDDVLIPLLCFIIKKFQIFIIEWMI